MVFPILLRWHFSIEPTPWWQLGSHSAVGNCERGICFDQLYSVVADKMYYWFIGIWRLSRWQLCRHNLQRWWQLPMQPMTTALSPWWPFSLKSSHATYLCILSLGSHQQPVHGMRMWVMVIAFSAIADQTIQVALDATCGQAHIQTIHDVLKFRYNVSVTGLLRHHKDNVRRIRDVVTFNVDLFVFVEQAPSRVVTGYWSQTMRYT